MEGILKNWRGFVNEGITSQGKITFDYYAFDWDDNLMKMPTKIIVLNSLNQEVGMSTHDFANYRAKLKSGEKFPYTTEDGEEYLIVGFADNPFRNFRVEGDEQFKSDAKIAPIVSGPWSRFVKAINMGSYFAIITARGHDPNTLREAVKELIMMDREGINKQSLIKSLRRYKNVLGEQIQPTIEGEEGTKQNEENTLIDEYLSNCQFSPVSNPQIAGTSGEGAASPEQLKIQQFEKFKQKMMELSEDIKEKLKDSKKIHSPRFRIGFSDDDPENIEKFHRYFHENKDVYTFATNPITGKTKRVR
jgi:hypothetical protein